MRTCRLVLCLAVLLLAARPAAAQLLFTLSPNALSGAPGTEVIFSGTITNNGALPVYLNILDPGLNGNGPLYLTQDQSVFNFVTSPLAAGASFNGQIFGLDIAPATPPGVYTGIANLLGGADSNANDILATEDYSVTVGVSPAPGALTMVAVAGVCGVLVRRARRRRRT